MKRILSYICATIALVSCGPTEEKEPVTLSASQKEIVFDYKGGSQTITITSDIMPTISSNKPWVNLTKGDLVNNSVQLTVQAGENDGTSERSATINVIGNKQSLMIPVTQEVEPVTLELSSSSLDAQCYGATETITVKSGTQPTATSNVDWCKVVVGNISNTRETEVKVIVGGNRKSSKRVANITISSGSASKTFTVRQDALTIETATTTAITPEIVFNTLQMGWNMGNQMDANSNGVASETVWGNKKCTQETFNGVKSAGFSSVRIPITWLGHIGEAPTYTIDEAWMARVEEIVGYCEKAGLVAIINTHHDENHGNSDNWQDVLKASQNSATNEKIKDQLFSMWCQIALRFKDKGQWLIFEPMNEINDGGWGWSKVFQANPEAQYKVLNEWNQVFVDAVRSTGGNNATRWLCTVGYCQSPSFTIKGLKMPTDYTTANRLMVGMHDYDPYEYTLKDPILRQFGHTADKSLSPSSAEEGLVWTFDQIKETYIDKGIPVYLGEMGCSMHNEEDMPYQKYYQEYFCKAAADRQIPMLLWDNGAVGRGSERHGYINHATGQFSSDDAKELIGIMVKAVTNKDPEYTLESVWNSAPTL